MVCIVGGFVVGHDGMGYTDIGEESEGVNEDARQEEDAGKDDDDVFASLEEYQAMIDNDLAN